VTHAGPHQEVAMFRKSRVAFGLSIVLSLAAGEARAQFGDGYPPGYGAYGWGGWGTGTVQGSIARGLGYYNMATGAGEREEAVANAINADTVGRWNEYLYLSQQEANHRHYVRQRLNEQATIASRDAYYKRLRDEPTPKDIENGDALNAILDQVTDPRIHSSALRMASTPIGAEVVRSIPFANGSEAITISLDQLTGDEKWPAALRGEALAPERTAYKLAITRALEEDEKGDISERTLADVRASLARLRAKYEAKPSTNRLESTEARNYLRTLDAMAKMLDEPQIEKVLAELEKIKDTSLGNLLAFMHTYNLRFGTPTNDKQRAIYRELYPMMVGHRNRVVGDMPPAPPEPVASKGRPSRFHPSEFFQGMELDPKKTDRK